MPGNGAGDRIHNFLEQGGLSQDQHHAQFVEGNWPVLFNNSNNVWSGSEKQIDGPLNSGTKNYNAVQSDIERGLNNQFSLGSYGLNLMQSNLKAPEFVKNQSQLQQWNASEYMHSSQVVPTRPNEANFLGVDTEPDQRNLTSRGLSSLGSQQSVLQHNHSASLRGSQSPMNYNFLGSQQHTSGQQPGLLNSLPWQQSSVTDAQLLQQQILLKQMQFEAMQRNAVGQMSTFPSPISGQHTSVVNSNNIGNQLHKASNNLWPSQVMAGNTNWQQRGLPSAMPGYSNGLVITPEQGQPMRLMGFPQQASQSLYGVPVSNPHTNNPYSHNSIDKPGPGVLQGPALGSSYPGNQHTSLAERVLMQDGITISRSESEGKNSFEQTSSQGSGNVADMRSLNQVQQCNMPLSEGGKQDSNNGSERAPKNSVTQPASSEVAVALDPTEEKILFGNDDNIWEAFGGPSVTETGGINRPDNVDILNGISSLQSGTWSALMQSAVAETSNSDTVMHEECSGLSSQHSHFRSENQMAPVLEDGKQPPVWVDSSHRASLGPLSATNCLRTADYLNTSCLPQSFLNQAESQNLQDERKWFDHNQPKLHAERNRVFEDASSYREQKTFLPDNSGQASGQPHALNFIESVPENGGVALANQDKFNGNMLNKDICMESGHDAPMRIKSDTFNHKLGSPHVKSMDDAVTSSLSNMVNREYGQNLLDNNHLDLQKPVNSTVNCGTDGLEKHHPNLNDRPPILESLGTMAHGRAAGLCETENDDRKENLIDNHDSSSSHHALSSRMKDNVCLDAVDQSSFPGGKEMSSNQSCKNMPVPQKFQYHPMGDVGMEVESYAGKHVLHSRSMSQHLSSVVTGHETQPRFLDSSITKSMDIEKGCSSNPQEAIKLSHANASSGSYPGYFPNTSAQFGRSGDISSLNQHVLPSQKMLELLHKVDQSKEQNIASHLIFSDSNRMSDIAFRGHVGLNQSQSSTAHGFNLQLAPPSQGVGPSNLHAASQSFSRPVESPNSGHLVCNKGDKARAWLGPVSSAQFFSPSHSANQMQSGNITPGVLDTMDVDGSAQNLKGKFSAPLVSGSPYMGNFLQNQHTPVVDGRIVTDRSAVQSFDRHAQLDYQNSFSPDQASIPSGDSLHHSLFSGRSLNCSGNKAFMHPLPPTGNSPGIYRKDNLSPPGTYPWTSQHHLLGIQDRNSGLLRSQFSNASEMSSLPQQKDEHDVSRKVDSVSSQGTLDRDGPSVVEAQSTEQTTGVPQEELIMRRASDASPSYSSASQKDGEGFRDTSTSNNASTRSYSLLPPMQSMNSTMTDPSHRESKRFKGLDEGAETAQPFTSGVNDVVRNPLVQASISVGDSKMLNFSPHPGNRITSSQISHGSVSSQDVISFGYNEPQKSVPSNLAGISPHMPPSWFEQYGTYKNGQLLPVHNVPRIPTNKNVEQQSISGKSLNGLVAHDSLLAANPAADVGQLFETCQTTSAYVPSELKSSPDALAPLVSTTSLPTSRPIKRKTATSDLLPWNEEIGHYIKRLHSMSLAEIDWAHSSNRLIEKAEDTDNNEKLLPMIRPKRRLILTTQLMQQVFRPPSAAVLSLKATSLCECIVYFLARLALGDACSVICCMGGDPRELAESENLQSEKVTTSEKVHDQYFSKVAEHLSNRAKELEKELLRLDKRASILDFRLECQDVERISVINRFARFIGRGPADGAEASSSSDVNVMAQKPSPQRYVFAHPMPRTVPDSVQCLSL